MKKEVKGKNVKKPFSSDRNNFHGFNQKLQIKKRIKEKNYNSNNHKSDTKEIKERVKPKHSKSYYETRAIFLGILLIAIIIGGCLIGIEFAAVAIVGSALIIGIGLLLKKAKSNKRRKKIINALIILILILGILAVSAFGAFFLYIKNIADPQFEKKEKALQTVESTLLYDMNGEIFAKLGSEYRTKIKYANLPEVLVDAIVATEDSRYFQHNGFDAPRFIKASIGQILGNSDAGGASTITMQVAKNTFSIDDNGEIASSGIEGIIRKFTDIYVSIFKLEKKYSKQEIIEFYVNNHLLGGNIYGVAEASETYFGKKVSDLNLSEAAIIAGMFKSPNYYRPTTNPENAEKRRAVVLSLMRRHGYITKEEEDMANAIPVASLIKTSSESSNPYQGYIDTLVEEAINKYGVNPYKVSLQVYTNLDRSKQDGVNAVLNGESYTWINDKVQCGVAVIDTATGKVLAVGTGRNVGKKVSGGRLQYNYATKIKRQPGSSAKPLFDYGPGIEYNNWSTYQLFDDAPYQYSSGQAIQNWDGGYFGVITLRRALATSRNIPALKAFQAVDNKKIVEFVTNLGIEPEISGGRIHEAHSLGAFTGVSPMQMAAAYSAFSNGGYYNEPWTISKLVYRGTGETHEHTADNYVVKRRAMSEATAYMIASVLQGVSLNGGTPYNMAVKTGTTNYDEDTMRNKGLPDDAIRDSWLVGFSTKTAMAMWYGYDYIDSYYCLHNFPDSRRKDLIYNALVNSGAVESNRSAFVQPSSVVNVGIAMGSDPPKLATATTKDVAYELFKKEYIPTEYDEAPLDTPNGFKATYNKNTKKVTLTWRAVSPSSQAKDSYGSLGYNVYKDGVLLDWTSKTSYTFDTSTPYATYKVIATYKSYSGIQSEAAQYTLHEEEEPKPSPSPSPTPDVTPTPSKEPTVQE